jgi:hypothetical protein
MFNQVPWDPLGLVNPVPYFANPSNFTVGKNKDLALLPHKSVIGGNDPVGGNMGFKNAVLRSPNTPFPWCYCAIFNIEPGPTRMPDLLNTINFFAKFRLLMGP